MKTLHLYIIVILASSLAIVSNTAFADVTKNVGIQNIQVQPPTIKVGDTFTVNVTLANNSPNQILLQHGVCDGPFSVVFDNHVTINQNQIICPMIVMLQKIESGEKITITSPGSALTYRATVAGTANATVTIPYTVRNQADQNQPETVKIISKSFLFTISDNNTGTKIVNENVLSPLKQFKSGIAAQDVKCKEGLQLVIKTKDSSPACVRSLTAAKLVRLGWAKTQENTGILVTLIEGQREGPLLVKKIFPDNIQGLDFREYPLATNVGYPITLHIGDSASNGCTVELTLVKISNGTATFLKKEYQNRPCPICLSENTVIDTPNGPVNVKDLKVGMTVLTQNNSGHKQAGIILKTGRTLVTQNHIMVHLVLADKRELYVSPNHPTADGRLFGDLLVGDTLDGSKIKSAEQVPYNGTYTYDILPSGQTGFYWADGIPVASTLK
ncbi:MAG TPA: Hint domain-containing protein [Nitrosopumilaceae archaeon]|nr:Hint domain-containing protein [Nitrosopumilaceae archaeon]